MIVVELIQIVPIHAPPSATVKRRPVILKGVKVLSCKRNKLFEVGVALGASFKVFDHSWEILCPKTTLEN